MVLKTERMKELLDRQMLKVYDATTIHVLQISDEISLEDFRDINKRIFCGITQFAGPGVWETQTLRALHAFCVTLPPQFPLQNVILAYCNCYMDAPGLVYEKVVKEFVAAYLHELDIFIRTVTYLERKRER